MECPRGGHIGNPPHTEIPPGVFMVIPSKVLMEMSLGVHTEISQISSGMIP